MFEPRVRRTTDGDFELQIPEEERRVLRSLPDQLRAVLREHQGGGAVLDRLFPPAHRDDPEIDREYRELVHDELVARRLSSVEVMEQTIGADRLDERQILAWLSAVNDCRLILGTRLDVSEDMDPDAIPATDPRASAFALYHYLSWLETEIVDALAEGLAPGSPD